MPAVTMPMATPTKSPASFNLFPRLPPELRLRIWDLNLPSSRLVPIHCGADFASLPDLNDAKDSKHSPSANPPGCSSPAPIPANLHACVESRSHALATRYSHALSFARSPGRVILDPLSDVLYFPPRRGYMAASAQFHTCMSLCSPADLRRVRRLALHEDLFSSSVFSSCCAPWYWSGLAVALTVECLRLVRDRMPAVEEVIFVSSSGACHSVDRGSDEEDDEDEEMLVVDDDEDDDAPARLVAQVQTAMRDLAAAGDGAWEPPRWTVVTEPREP